MHYIRRKNGWAVLSSVNIHLHATGIVRSTLHLDGHDSYIILWNFEG